VKPFDPIIMRAMANATIRTVSAMQGFKLGYVQSDEATFLLTDFDTHDTEGWFGYNLQKVVSVAASHFTANFNHEITSAFLGREIDRHPPLATFDARAFIVPQDDAPNVFIWRQQDWHRNSVQMLAHANFSHKELHGKNIPTMHEMLAGIGIDWEDCSDQEKFGTYISAERLDFHEPLTYDQIRDMIWSNEAELPSS
jgi:tRNA(His) 5'-end guanylyltransferase